MAVLSEERERMGGWRRERAEPGEQIMAAATPTVLLKDWLLAWLASAGAATSAAPMPWSRCRRTSCLAFEMFLGLLVEVTWKKPTGVSLLMLRLCRSNS